MSHVMLDLETLGNGSNAVIISIGAVQFIPETNEIGETFSMNVDPASCVQWGLKIDASTVMWWMKQSDQARAKFAEPSFLLNEALAHFRDYINSFSTEDDIQIWGNGATFDNVVLANAYLAIGEDKPWSYRNDRCYRTLKALYPHIKQEQIGTSHCAVDDAEYQARLLMKIFKEMEKA